MIFICMEKGTKGLFVIYSMGRIWIFGCQNVCYPACSFVKKGAFPNGFGEKFMYAIYINFTGFSNIYKQYLNTILSPFRKCMKLL